MEQIHDPILVEYLSQVRDFVMNYDPARDKDRTFPTFTQWKKENNKNILPVKEFVKEFNYPRNWNVMAVEIHDGVVTIHSFIMEKNEFNRYVDTTAITMNPFFDEDCPNTLKEYLLKFPRGYTFFSDESDDIDGNVFDVICYSKNDTVDGCVILPENELFRLKNMPNGRYLVGLTD